MYIQCGVVWCIVLADVHVCLCVAQVLCLQVQSKLTSMTDVEQSKQPVITGKKTKLPVFCSKCAMHSDSRNTVIKYAQGWGLDARQKISISWSSCFSARSHIYTSLAVSLSVRLHLHAACIS